MLKRNLITTAFALIVAGSAAAKGLNDITNANPAKADEAPEPSTAPAAAGTKPATPEASPAPAASEPVAATPVEAVKESEESKALAGNLFAAQSFGWVRGGAAKGNWTTSGMSDFTIGGKIPVEIMPKLQAFGTFRYAPIAFSGKSNSVSYRGVWESYGFGGLAKYMVNPDFTANGALEISYVVSYLKTLDPVEADKALENNGVSFTLGVGGDYAVFDKVAIGPRLNLMFGHVSATQFAVHSSFMF